MLSALLAAFAWACKEPAPPPAKAPLEAERTAAAPKEKARLHVGVSVDWEGAYLTPEGLEMMGTFRERMPDVPLTHFISAGYFTKHGADALEVTRKIRSALRPGDEIALHLHMWKSFVERAGVKFRTEPTFFNEESLMEFEDGDIGFEVQAGAYDDRELDAIFRTSKEIFEKAGLPLSTSVRVGGWLGTPKLLAASRRAGFLTDCSSTDAKWMDELKALQRHVAELWPNVKDDTVPFWIDTPAGRILEVPDTGSLADLVTADEMVALADREAARIGGSAGGRGHVHLGFHQESAADFAPRLLEALDRIKEKHGEILVFETVEALAERLRAEAPR